MKVLFCIYQLDFADHIAVAFLSAVARKRGHSTSLHVMAEGSLEDKVRELKPDVVAYSANIQGFEEMVAAHKAARLAQSFVSIMGGPHPTVSPETFAEAGVDAYCIGEGEEAFDDFLCRVERSEQFDDVPNLVTARARNPVRPLVKDLDSLPFPDRDLTLGNSYLKDTPKKTFYATRGCPYNCTYCANNLYHQLYRGMGPTVRRFSVERVLCEIEYVRDRYRMEFVKFGDDVFALRADEWLEEFCPKYRARIGIPFNCYLRLDTVTDRLLVLLKEAGCYSVHLSLDSTSEHVREKVLGRRMRRVDVVAILRQIHDAGINTWVNYMLAAPESTLEDDLETIEVSRRGMVTYPSYSTTVPTKGTALYDYCVEKGLIDPAMHRSDMAGCSLPSTLKCFSPRERRIRYNIYLLGALAAKLPGPLSRLAVGLIRAVPPNRVFAAMRERYYRYSIENRIFRLHAGNGRA